MKKTETQPLTVRPNAMSRMQEILKQKQAGGNEDGREGGNEGEIQAVSDASIPANLSPVSEDWREEVRESARKGVSEPVRTTRLNADIDEALHTRLRIHCMSKGLRLKELIPALLEKYLEEE